MTTYSLVNTYKLTSGDIKLIERAYGDDIRSIAIVLNLMRSKKLYNQFRADLHHKTVCWLQDPYSRARPLSDKQIDCLDWTRYWQRKALYFKKLAEDNGLIPKESASAPNGATRAEHLESFH